VRACGVRNRFFTLFFTGARGVLIFGLRDLWIACPSTHPSELASQESALTPPRDEAAQARSLNDWRILSRWGRRYRSC